LAVGRSAAEETAHGLRRGGASSWPGPATEGDCGDASIRCIASLPSPRVAPGRHFDVLFCVDEVSTNECGGAPSSLTHDGDSIALPLDACRQYWQQSRLPLVSLAFVLPFLALYEGGVLLLGEEALRNGADVWLRSGLSNLGLGHYFLLPALTIGLLLAGQHARQASWRFSPTVLYGMACESLLLGAALLLAAELQGTALRHVLSWEGTLPSCAIRGDSLGSVVAFAGAGVYEEALFRLALLPLTACLAQALGAPRWSAVAMAVLVTSLAFAGAHHLGPSGEAFLWPAFVFRTLAGGAFACVFFYRGFGIAAGMHVGYDILVAVV
jgi:hypothetical protein